MSKGEPVAFVRNGEPVTSDTFSLRCSKSLLCDKEKNLYYTDWAMSYI